MAPSPAPLTSENKAPAPALAPSKNHSTLASAPVPLTSENKALAPALAPSKNPSFLAPSSSSGSSSPALMYDIDVLMHVFYIV